MTKSSFKEIDGMDLTFLKNRWNTFAATGAWLATLLGGFVLRPPWWDKTEDASWYMFANFTLAFLVALFLLPMSRYRGKRHAWWWWAPSVVFFVAAFLVFDQYQTLRASWTVPYAGGRVLIGATYTPDAQRRIADVRQTQNRTLTDADLVMDFGGDIDSIWEKDGLREHRRVIAWWYLGSLALLASAVLAVVQAAYCSSRNENA
jgi:hypothetical protein